MNWLERKIFLYNVTIGLYMLDWWERYLINTLLILLTWFLIKLAGPILVNILVPIVALLCKSSLGFSVSWLCSHSTASTISDTTTGILLPRQ